MLTACCTFRGSGKIHASYVCLKEYGNIFEMAAYAVECWLNIHICNVYIKTFSEKIAHFYDMIVVCSLWVVKKKHCLSGVACFFYFTNTWFHRNFTDLLSLRFGGFFPPFFLWLLTIILEYFQHVCLTAKTATLSTLMNALCLTFPC